ncbi:hypothetical protein DL764_004472 [Monosporascus ibericus]|uniref:SNF2 N-terminal domain-containing protein n=1 Tax=Monosporascus ibericus TaxID=155417 RepID=A0A4Q4TCV2_9PEZI|nr:hypothetical protein DL764_004472 [Monosporascus ibericus]
MKSQPTRGPRKTTSPESAAAPPPRRKRASPSLENAVGTDTEEDLTSGSDEEIPAARGSQETTGCTRVPDTGEAHDTRGPPQSKASLQEVLERYGETMRATLFDRVEASPSMYPSEHSQTEALPINTPSPLRGPTSIDLSNRVGRPRHQSETESQGLPYQRASRPTMEQRPVEPKRVIDLSADDNAFPSYDAFIEPYNGGWVDAAWTGTCELFGCSVTATEVKIAGFSLREGAAGGLLADDMGLGKTIESLAVVVVRRRLLQSQDHVRDNFDTGSLEVFVRYHEVRLHLLQRLISDGIDSKLLFALSKVKPQLTPGRVPR